MPDFTKAIETDLGFMNFWFDRIFTTQGVRYHISAIGRNDKAIIFHMEEVDGTWVIIKTKETPVWVEGLENKLSKAISEYKNGS